MNCQWFAERLASSDLKQHSAAAAFLRGQGLEGYPHVPAMLRRCKELDLSKDTFDKGAEHLLFMGTRSIATIIRDYGFDASDLLHKAALEWMVTLTMYPTARVVPAGIWALGDLGVPPETVRTRLSELVTSRLLPDESGVITCRGIAFRMLARVDRRSASHFVSTPACSEYLSAVDLWISDYQRRFPNGTPGWTELNAEVVWLRA